MSKPEMILALCECGERFWRDSQDQERHCTECTEKRPGPHANENRTAETNSQKEEAAMSKSTTLNPSPAETSAAVNRYCGEEIRTIDDFFRWSTARGLKPSDVLKAAIEQSGEPA